MSDDDKGWIPEALYDLGCGPPPDDDLKDVLNRPKTRGGNRKGAGPKPIYTENMVPVCFRISVRQRSLLREFGGAAGGQNALVRRLLDEYFKI